MAITRFGFFKIIRYAIHYKIQNDKKGHVYFLLKFQAHKRRPRKIKLIQNQENQLRLKSGAY